MKVITLKTQKSLHHPQAIHIIFINHQNSNYYFFSTIKKKDLEKGGNWALQHHGQLIELFYFFERVR